MSARFLRLHVQAWFNHPSLKMDIIGCQSRCFRVLLLRKQGGVQVQNVFRDLKVKIFEKITHPHSSTYNFIVVHY